MAELNQPELVIRIPVKSKLYLLAELPVTTRLANIFARLGLATISDLTSENLDRILESRGFGQTSLDDLISVTERIEAGHFPLAEIKSLSQIEFAEILRTIDDAVSEMPPSRRELISLRFGASGRPSPTLEDLGHYFKCTRQNVSLRIQHIIERIRKEIDPTLLKQLDFLAKQCLQDVVPLDPNLFAYFLGRKQSAASRYQYQQNAGYYMNMLKNLLPEIPVWPLGHEPRPTQVTSVLGNDKLERHRGRDSQDW